ncbi:MAG: GNAT family N-acetyltransferase [Planctomycetes bacterium]|nr:GNAT family N-acetyltransferase [Planctomycetota bacterium]
MTAIAIAADQASSQRASGFTVADAVALRAEQRSAAAVALTHSLLDDPLNVHFLPDRAARIRVLPALMRTFLAYAAARGQTLTTAETAGVMMLLPPDECRVSAWGMLRAGLPRAAWRAGPSAFVRFARAGSWLEQLRFAHAPGPHWYVLAQAVAPEHQRRGVAAALMRRALAIADADGRPVHAETFTPQNARYYERFGLCTIAEADLPHGGPHVWVLARPVGG